MTSTAPGCKIRLNNWTVRPMDSQLYRLQKSIAIDHQPVETHQFIEEGKAASSLEIWHSVYHPRVRQLMGETVEAPNVFPGRPPALETKLSQQNFAFDRFQVIKDYPCSSLRENFSHLLAPQIHAPQTQAQYLQQSTSGFHINNVSELRSLFESIHAMWCPFVPADYENKALSIAYEFVREKELVSESVLFELEEFASYCSLRNRFEMVASGFYANCWLDIASVSPPFLRGTEKCLSERLLQELHNFAFGRIAPLIVNEFRCVSDGNHRLTASWIWNMLHAARELEWQWTSRKFTDKNSAFIANNQSDIAEFSIKTAGQHLKALLEDATSAAILEQLAPAIRANRIDELPIIPLPSYNYFAADRLLLEASDQLVRFNPEFYSLMNQDKDLHLDARACLHHIDRVALPWFSILTRSDASQTRKSATAALAQ